MSSFTTSTTTTTATITSEYDQEQNIQKDKKQKNNTNNNTKNNTKNDMKINDIKKYVIFPKNQDHGRWYQTVLTVSDMIDYSAVSGCYVLKPLAIQLWEKIKSDLNNSITKLGVDNYYFPLFVTKTNLEKESNHFSDFIPEVAWIVTHDTIAQNQQLIDTEISDAIRLLESKGLEVNIRTKSTERYAVRPTSETIIYPHFSEWIKKSGTYPKINQWANVIRWENKATQPFIRSREFLWQEGHTCHPTKESALEEVYIVLDMYKNLYESLLAVPMIDGRKTKSETFPGAEFTTTIEGFLPDSGKGIQSATSHYLGQKFSTIFNIKDSKGQLVHQNSWGLTTRSIGIMVMTHSDDKGLILPPFIAPIQVVLIACGITVKTTKEEKDAVYTKLHTLEENFNKSGIRTIFDDDNTETPGMKFNKWEVRGVPLRLEFGPKDMINNTIIFVRRDKPAKTREIVNIDHIDLHFMIDYLTNIQSDMFETAKCRLKESIVYCNTDEEIINSLKDKKLALIDWTETYDEERLKQICRDNDINSTKILCIPNNDTLKKIDHYFEFINESNKEYALFGRSY